MKKIIFIILFLFLSIDGYCANRYWVGGGATADWDATGNTNWGTASNTQDNASVPGSSDDVIFDGVGTGASDATANVDTTILSIDFTGYANTFTHNSSVNINVAGNITLVSGMTYTLGSNFSSKFTMTATGSMTTGGKTIGRFHINASGGTCTLQDAFSGSSNGGIELDLGTLNTNNQTVSVAHFDSDNSNVRALTLGSTVWTCTKDTGDKWRLSTSTNMTLTANTSEIHITNANADFSGGGLIYNDVRLSGNFGTHEVTGANTYDDFFISDDNITISLQASVTQTMADFTSVGTSGREITLNSLTPATVATVLKTGGGTIEEDFLDVVDVTGTPGSTWYYGNNGSGDNASGWAAVPSTGNPVSVDTIIQGDMELQGSITIQ